MSRSWVAVSAAVFVLFTVSGIEAAVNNGEACQNHGDCVKNAFCWNKLCNCGYGYGSTSDKKQCIKVSNTCGGDDDCRGSGTCPEVPADDEATTPRICLCPAGWTGSRCEAKIVSGSLQSGIELEKAKQTAGG